MEALNENASTPEAQREEVLKLYAVANKNAQIFWQFMVGNGFPAARLLMAHKNKATQIFGLNNYQAESLVFNTRYQYHPSVIVMCESTEEVQQAYKTAIHYNLPIRVRAGGHDHAGESSGDNVVLIDVTGIKSFSISDEHIATIGAGYRFYELTPLLAEKDRMIAHGTCATVGLTGFIQGGGWGPWTRKYGMCCESLVGATLVLGDGSIVELDQNDTDESKQALLWALRGGGGMSYGIITELKLQTFALPNTIHRFEIEWNKLTKESKSTVEILKQWEAAISPSESPNLLGTNLKINALSSSETTADAFQQCHHCVMYGYWEGSKTELETFINQSFEDMYDKHPDQIKIHEAHGAGDDIKMKYDHQLMGNWARNSLHNITHQPSNPALLANGGTPFTPDYDAPAPHKLTSRFVDHNGLNDEGYRQFIETLTSPLLRPENEGYGLFSYVTLGAINGAFYETPEKLPDIAFPYRNRQYTIQYQTWWNEDIRKKIEQQNNQVYVDVNRAMDWIDRSREAEIERTGGAFISFKDPAIPTEVYFAESYEKLIKVKKECVKDEFNHLRTRKTIL